MKYGNLLLIFFGALGGAMLASLFGEVGIETQRIAQTILWIFMGLLLLFPVYWYGIRRETFGGIQEDERTKANVDKSARNGFIST